MNNKANPTALGYASIFITGWLYSMASAGWFGLTAIPEIGLVTGIVLGVITVLIGIFLYFRGDTLDMSLFIGFGVFVYIVARINMSDGSASIDEVEGYAAGMFDVVWAVYFAFLWLANRSIGGIKSWFLLGLTLTILVHGLAYFTSAVLILIGGYIGLITSLVAAWISYSEITDALQPAHTNTRSEKIE